MYMNIFSANVYHQRIVSRFLEPIYPMSWTGAFSRRRKKQTLSPKKKQKNSRWTSIESVTDSMAQDKNWYATLSNRREKQDEKRYKYVFVSSRPYAETTPAVYHFHSYEFSCWHSHSTPWWFIVVTRYSFNRRKIVISVHNLITSHKNSGLMYF